MDSLACQRFADGIARLQQAGERRHGACVVRVTPKFDLPAGELQLHGVVLVDKLRRSVYALARRTFAARWKLRDHMDAYSSGTWLQLPEPPMLRDQGGSLLQFAEQQGPLECLLERDGAVLLRDRFGTAAWATCDAGQAREVGACSLPRPRPDRDAFVAACVRVLGCRYRRGASGPAAFDCSGLVQRAAWSALRVALPRHSGDLARLGVTTGCARPAGDGDLVFGWGGAEASCHVGVRVGERVVHASSTRQRVVCDSARVWRASFAHVRWVAFDDLLAWGRRCAGAHQLLAGGIRLGAYA